eukprot:m.159020 g.159020  ORF g.159020 m.159020 type:complete len:742 (+) comp15145_c0_seq4:511-2736(+)
MLCAYKIYIDGTLVSLGPGRGEANVLEGNNTFMHAPYTTIDISLFASPKSIVAVEGMAPLYETPCNAHTCQDPNTKGGGILAQINLAFADGTTDTLYTNSEGDWQSIGLDDYRQPTLPGTKVPGISGQTAYAKVLENIDAAKETLNWKISDSVSPAWPPALPAAVQNKSELVARMARPIEVYGNPTGTPTYDSDDIHVFVDYVREFQGGIILDVNDGSPGTVLQFITGELLMPNGTYDNSTESRISGDNTWGYEFNWTLRGGAQTIIQHEYMLFRYVAVKLIKGSMPKNMSFKSWAVRYEYVEKDSQFISSNKMLNAVHELARWTLDGGVLDTYTDSNTRERRPYECDGLIAAAGRGLIQNDYMWGRHSHSWVLENPTWPLEWQQMSALLAWQDYMFTGMADIFSTYEDRIYSRTNYGSIDSTGLLNTSTGRHIIGWDPAPTKEMFTGNAHTSVDNGWCIRGLQALSSLASAVGNKNNATRYAQEANTLLSNMHKAMWDKTNSRYCDGPCTDPDVNGHGGITTNYFTLYFGIVPDESISAVWHQIATTGMTGFGDYGAFIFLNALARYTQDDGSAMLTALTKCDQFSYCNEMRLYNATMTTESLGVPHQTMSHPWGTAPIPAIIHGIMGITQTAPAWSKFTIKPAIASLSFANVTVPTLRGPIHVTATPKNLIISIPCNTMTKLCFPKSRWLSQMLTAKSLDSMTLYLNGRQVGGESTKDGWKCVTEVVSCQAHPLKLELV